MITKDTIARIVESAHIEEVVGEFVTLKKRGSRYIGNCPFHNEKTPSFTVTPSLNIYKCFGCGVAGDSIKFLMEKEKLSYPDSLRYLAQKYNIEIEENYEQKESSETLSEKDALYEINGFAQKFFSHYLLEQEEGKAVGLSYFKERGLTEDTIKKFQLGFSPEKESSLLQSAKSSNFTFDILKKAGLAAERGGRELDFFRGRVMFPIHGMTGKVLAFGGRVLKKDNGPKYINTPETEVYHKSQILYGIFQAKGDIRKQDECLLTEGYMDVVALSQAGIHNAVASSGTSLTREQVKLIKRLTENVTILYDGDAAGIKAALRGIDILLEEGLNARIVLLPEPEDPDSYIQKYGAQQFLDYKKNEGKDFILFKSALLLKDVQNDPVKKTDALKDIVQSISLIQDAIKRSMYIKECAGLFKIDEQILISEINKIKRVKLAKENDKPTEELKPLEEDWDAPRQETIPDRMSFLEKDVIRLLFEFAYIPFDEKGNILEYTLHELDADNFMFSNPVYQEIISNYRKALDNNELLDNNYFFTHSNPSISILAFDILNKPYEISANWKLKHNVVIAEKETLVKIDLESIVLKLKIELINQKIIQIDEESKSGISEDESYKLLVKKQAYLNAKKDLAKRLGSVVI